MTPTPQDELDHLIDSMTAVPAQFITSPAAARSATEVAMAASQAAAANYNHSLQNVANQMHAHAGAQNAMQNNFQHGMLSGMVVSQLGGPQYGQPGAMGQNQPNPFAQMFDQHFDTKAARRGQMLAALDMMNKATRERFDTKAARRGQMLAALDMMNKAARERFEPVFELMDIHVVAPAILPQSINSHPNEWRMELKVKGHGYRHVFDLEDNTLAGWSAEVGYLLDKVARLQQPEQDQDGPGELVPVAGRADHPEGNESTGAGNANTGNAA